MPLTYRQSNRYLIGPELGIMQTLSSKDCRQIIGFSVSVLSINIEMGNPSDFRKPHPT